MTNQLGKFVSHLTDITKPLRDLLKLETEWIWSEVQEESFVKVKQALTKAPILAHYDSKAKTIVSSDASSFGLGAVLLQWDSEIE